MKVLGNLKFSEFSEMNDREMKLTLGGSGGSGSGSDECPMSTGSDWSCYCVLTSGGTCSWGCCGGPEEGCAAQGNSVCDRETIRCFFRT